VDIYLSQRNTVTGLRKLKTFRVKIGRLMISYAWERLVKAVTVRFLE
jgi:hypothetical protein